MWISYPQGMWTNTRSYPPILNDVDKFSTEIVDKHKKMWVDCAQLKPKCG